MAAPSITAFPEKIINTFLSKWNAASLPIQYTINNDKFPVGEVVTNYFTQVLIFINSVLVATIKQIPDSSNNTKVDVRKYAQTALKLVQSSGTRDTNASCEIFITGSEEYIDAASLPQSNAITGGGAGVIHYGTLSALPFGGSRGGNMYDYIMDRNKADLGKFMTFFIRGQLVDNTDFLLSFILNETGYDFEVKQFDINAVLLLTELISIPDEGVGVYRITLDSVSFESDVNYLTVEILTDTYGTAVSEIFNIDVDLACAVSPTAPSGLTATVNATTPKTAIDLAWSDNSDDETGFIIRRGLISGALSKIATVGPNTTTYADTGLDDGTEYFYDVIAQGAINSSPSNEASATTNYDFSDCVRFDEINDQMAVINFSEATANSYTMIVWFQDTIIPPVPVSTSWRVLGLRWDADAVFVLMFIGTTNAKQATWDLSATVAGLGVITGNQTCGGGGGGQCITRNNTKHLAVFNVDFVGKRIRGYVDGEGEVMNFTFTAAPPTNWEVVAQGFFNEIGCNILETRVLIDNMLSADDVTTIFNSGNGSNFLDDNFVAGDFGGLWKYSEGTGTSVADESGNGRNWTLINFADTGFGTELTVSAESGTPTVGDTVTGGTSAATGIVVSYVATDLEIKIVFGQFEAAEAVTSPGYSATVDSVLERAWDEVQ